MSRIVVAEPIKTKVITVEQVKVVRGLPAFVVRHYRLKNSIDMIGAVVGLLIIAPFLPFIAFAIKLESRGPVFVTLERISEGRKIRVYKFRTMIKNAHRMKKKLMRFNERTDGPFFKMKRDPRITWVGRLLRKFRIDEFPQFINVLKGELSLVGPRPHEPQEVAQYSAEYRYLLLAKAGVTGLSQVSGASSLPYLQELELDGYYIKNASIFFDAKILARTVKIMFSDPSAV